MGFKENFKNFFTPADDDMYEDDDSRQEAELDYEYEEKPRKASRLEQQEKQNRQQPSNVTGMNRAAQLQVVLVKPETFEDGLSIADHLCTRRTVVVNFENAPKDVVRRLVDFLSGVAYANKGNIKRAANNAFVVTPNNVDVMGDVLFDDGDTGSFGRD